MLHIQEIKTKTACIK